MTDEEKISTIALILGDIPGGPYYPMFTEEQYKQFLSAGGGDMNRALLYAAISATYFTSGESSREVIGELQISSSSSANYLKLLDHIKDTFGKIPPANLMPWFAGANKRDCNKLLDYSRCDKRPQWQKITGDPCSADSGDC